MTQLNELRQFGDVMKRVGDQYTQETLRHQRMIAQIGETRDLIGEATKRFIETGVAYVDVRTAQLAETINVHTRSYFKDIAKELGRTCLQAEQTTQQVLGKGWKAQSFIDLAIPKSTKNSNLASALLLISTVDDDFQPCSGSSYRSNLASATVIRKESGRTWYFYFIGDKGLEEFEAFRDQCRTNPIFRIVLGL